VAATLVQAAINQRPCDKHETSATDKPPMDTR